MTVVFRLLGACAVAALLLGAGARQAEDTVTLGTVVTTVDGVIHDGEYSYSHEDGPVTLFVNRSADTLYLGVLGSTTGWVAVGIGSQKMNGATIFIGYVKDDGMVAFKPQVGTGHTHADASSAAMSSIVSYAIKEAGGKTTLEIALKAESYISPGQDFLELIYAVGPAKSFEPRHFHRNALRLKLS